MTGNRICGLLLAIMAVALWFEFGPARAAEFDDALTRELDMIFDQRRDRAEAYVDWTYGWATSYVNSYHAAARVLVSFWKTPEAGWSQNFIGSLRTFQHQAIVERVTRPKDSAVEISNLIDRYVAGNLYLLQSQTLGQLCESRPHDECQTIIEPQLRELARSTEALRLDPEVRSREISELAALFDFGNDESVDLLHAARPITTRLVILVLRLTEFASLVVVVSQSLRTAYVPDTVVTRWIVTLMVVWALDYVVLSAERFANKESFLASITAQVMAPQTAVENYVRTQIDASEAAFVERSAQLSAEFR